MDTTSEDRILFAHVTDFISVSTADVSKPGSLALEIIQQAEAEVKRLDQLKARKMELFLNKQLELVEICKIEGKGGLFKFMEKRLEENGHMVIVSAKGAGQDLVAESMRKMDQQDASGNKLLLDVGLWISQKIKAIFFRVDDAYELIRSMPMDCNAIVWRELLGARCVHGNIKLGECVRRHLLELEPNHSGDYVLLANMYASDGQWKVREAMRNRGVQKPEPEIMALWTVVRAINIFFKELCF